MSYPSSWYVAYSCTQLHGSEVCYSCTSALGRGSWVPSARSLLERVTSVGGMGFVKDASPLCTLCGICRAPPPTLLHTHTSAPTEHPP